MGEPYDEGKGTDHLVGRLQVRLVGCLQIRLLSRLVGRLLEKRRPWQDMARFLLRDREPLHRRVVPRLENSGCYGSSGYIRFENEGRYRSQHRKETTES